jgi:cytochrome c5
MQQVKTGCAMASKLMALNLFTLTLIAVGPAFGQVQQLVKLPYEFALASKVLPAGTYTFSNENDWLRVRSAAGVEVRVRVIARLGGSSAFLEDGSLVFDKTSVPHALCEVWIPGTDGVLLHSMPRGHSRDVLLLSDLRPTPNVSGRAVYDQTCRRCHGPDGKGEPKADKFFNIAVPRLSSMEVQAKSDAQLKEVITRGSSTMPPVEIDESGFRHRLPVASVDAVIAYVRTLKR